MRKVLVLFNTLLLSLIVFSACSQQEPVTQEPLAAYSAEQAEALYLLGNEEPIEAEEPSNFLFHGPGPFFLWALDLTDEQKEQLREIGQAHREEMHDQFMEMRQNGDWEAMKEVHEELREKMLKEIMNILTDEQKAILEEIQAQIDAGQYPTIIIDKRIATLTEKLELTPEQQDSVRSLMEAYGAELLQLRAQSEDHRAMHNQIRGLLDEYITALKALLNEEQLIIFEEMRSEFKANHPRWSHSNRHRH